MKRVACVASALAILVLAAGADDATTPSIKEVMTKLHKGANAPLSKLKTALKAESPDWTSIRISTAQVTVLGASLPKNAPPKGEKADYERRARAYLANAKDLNAAAKAEDKAQAQAALDKLGASCKDCHSAHKGK